MGGPAGSADLNSSMVRSGLSGSAHQSWASLHCLICNGVQHATVFTERGIDILRCKRCGHVFSSFPADPHYSGFWGDDVAPGAHHYWSKARARMHRAFFHRFVAGRSGRMLDMGCGLGFFLKAMSAYPSWNAFGCEVSPAAVRYAREELGLRQVVCTPLQDAPLAPASFDLITMWDVIDHIPHPDPLLSRCHSLLQNDGVLFIRTPNISIQLPRARAMRTIAPFRSSKQYLQGADHAHHYSMRSIRRLLERNGFADVAFLHLPPVETGRGWRGVPVNAAKYASFQLLRALAACSGGSLNFDNLFVTARKSAAASSS